MSSSSSCFNLYQLRQQLLGSSQLFSQVSALLNSFHNFPQLFSTIFAALFRSFHLFSPLFNFSHDFSLLVNSSQRLSSISLQLFSILLNSSQLFSPQLNSSKFFSARLNSFQAQTCSTLLPFARCLWLVQLVFVLFPGNSFVIINSFLPRFNYPQLFYIFFNRLNLLILNASGFLLIYPD